MKITRGPFSADVNPIHIAGETQPGYQVAGSRYGIPVYEQLESDFEEAMRIAHAYVDWQLGHHTDC
jgi:hypothetical protein